MFNLKVTFYYPLVPYRCQAKTIDTKTGVPDTITDIKMFDPAPDMNKQHGI